MLSDEEKEAIEKLSAKKNETTWDDTIRRIKREEIKDVVVTRQKYITSILNIIEKQSKEIEELKEDNEHQWEERCKLTFELENSTSNDKIKAKIEYYEKIDNAVGVRILESLLEKEFPVTITKEELEKRWKE